jgi:hypothetical protein
VTKQLFSLFAFIAVLPVVSDAQDSKPVTKAAPDKIYKLEYKFAPEKTETYRYRASQKSDELNFELKGKKVLAETCKSFDKDKKIAKVEQQTKRLQLTMTMGDKKEEYDSESQEESDSRLKVIGSKLLHKASFDVNTKGHIKRQKKPDESGQDIFKSPFLSIENVPYDMIRLPEKGIKVGATWTSVLEKTIKQREDSMTFKTTYTYTLKRVKTKGREDLATISFASSTELQPSDESNSLTAKSIAGKGSAIFNVNQGRLKSINFSLKIDVAELGRDRKMKYNFSMRHLKAEEAKEKPKTKE